MRVRTHSNPFSFRETLPEVDFEQVFPDFKGILDVEVGFGRGIFLRSYAQKYPERSILGVEIRQQIVSILQGQLDRAGIKNVLALHASAEVSFPKLINL